MPETYGFDSKNRDRKIYIDFVLGQEFATVNEMLDILKRTYCSTLGVEFLHITDPEQKSWINYLAETQRNTEYKTPLYYLYQKI